MCHFLALAGNRKSCDKKRLQFSAADGMITKQTIQGSFIGRTPYPPSRGRRVRSQAFCHRKMARCMASQLLAEPKENAQGHGGGAAAGVFPYPAPTTIKRGVSSSVERSLPKPQRRVRFPYPAPKRDAIHSDGISFWSTDPAMNLWFDRPAILCEAQRLRIAQTVLSV